MSIEITEKLKDEVRTYWRDTVKDKDALARTADLFGLREEDVKRILAVRWKEKKNFWTEDRVFRLKAYMAQGMGNTEIAKQLGCKTQAVADFKRRNRDMLPAYGKERKKECEKDFDEIINSVAENPQSGFFHEINSRCEFFRDEGKKKEPLTLGDVKDSEKNTIVEVDSSVDNYSMKNEKCQECRSESGDDDVTTEMYNDLYTRFLEMWNKCEDAQAMLCDAELILKTAKYAGIQWCELHETSENELADCCRMYDMLISRALEAIEKIRKILEG